MSHIASLRSHALTIVVSRNTRTLVKAPNHASTHVVLQGHIMEEVNAGFSSDLVCLLSSGLFKTWEALSHLLLASGKKMPLCSRSKWLIVTTLRTPLSRQRCVRYALQQSLRLPPFRPLTLPSPFEVDESKRVGMLDAGVVGQFVSAFAFCGSVPLFVYLGQL